MRKYQRIRDLREDKDMKQWQIAEVIKMSQTQYQRYESGEREIPLHLMIELAEYYNVSMDYITGLSNDKGGLHYKYKTEEEKNIMEMYEELEETEKEEIRNIMEFKIKQKRKNRERKSVG